MLGFLIIEMRIPFVVTVVASVVLSFVELLSTSAAVVGDFYVNGRHHIDHIIC